MSDILNKLLNLSSRNTKLVQLVTECIQRLKVNPNSIEILQQLTEAYNLLGQYNKAIRSCNEILERDLNNKVALNNLFFAVDRLENFERALNILKSYLEMFPLSKNKKFQQLPGLRDYFKGGENTPFFEIYLPLNYPSIIIDLNYNTSFQFSKVGYSSRCLEVLKIILKKYPFDVDTWNALGNRYFSLERYEKAKDILNKALEIEPNNKFTHLKLGQIHLEGGEFEKAKEEFFFVIKEQNLDQLQIIDDHEMSPSQYFENKFDIVNLIIAAWSGLGNIYSEMGKYEDAIDAYNKSLSYYKQIFSSLKTPAIAPIYKNLGIAHHALGNNKESLKTFKIALKHDPEFVDVLGCMSELYLEMKKFKYAIEILQHLVSIKPEDHLAWYLLSKSYFKSGKISYASEANARCLKLNPKFKPALELNKKFS